MHTSPPLDVNDHTMITSTTYPDPPVYRHCKGPCGRLLLVSSETYPTRAGERYRYPWTTSYYRPICRACTTVKLRDLKATTRTAQQRAKAAKRREWERAAKASLGMSVAQIRASRAAQDVKDAQALRKAQAKALVKRTFPRPYDPAKDPIKNKIKADTQLAVRKRLATSSWLAEDLETNETNGAHQVDPDHFAQLQAIRDRHRRGTDG
jgi:hypothetical protein